MICSKCFKRTDDGKFCTNCGAVLVEESAAINPPAEEINPPAPKSATAWFKKADDFSGEAKTEDDLSPENADLGVKVDMEAGTTAVTADTPVYTPPVSRLKISTNINRERQNVIETETTHVKTFDEPNKTNIEDTPGMEAVTSPDMTPGDDVTLQADVAYDMAPTSEIPPKTHTTGKKKLRKWSIVYALVGVLSVVAGSACGYLSATGKTPWSSHNKATSGATVELEEPKNAEITITEVNAEPAEQAV